MVKKRIFYYDVLRAIAIIGIVFCHASVSFILTGVDNPTFPISAFFDCFRDFSIPIFVMLSGALLINRKDSLGDFFKKRLSRLFIPFVFWVIVYSIYSAVYIKHSFDISSALDIFLGAPGTLGVAFWFIWMIVIVYCEIFLINRIIIYGSGKRENFEKEFITLLTVFSVIYIVLSNFGILGNYSSKLLYFMSFIAYVIIGYFISHYDLVGSRVSANKMIIVTLLISCALYGYYIFGFVVPKSIQANHFVYKGYFNLLILALSVNIFCLFKYLSKTKYLMYIEDKTLGKVFITISKYSFGLYLCHYMILIILKINLIRIYYNQSPLLWIPILVILTTVISLSILGILNRIPYLNKFTGKS